MRIAIDMQGALTHGSRPRGIGRYTTNLVRTMIDMRGEHDINLLLNGNFGAVTHDVAQNFERSLPEHAISVYRVPPSQGFRVSNRSPRRGIAEAIVRRHVALHDPDVLLFSSLFEQASEDFSPINLTKYPAKLTSVILYDLIPLVFENHYLADFTAKSSFYEIIETMRGVDLALAISESSKSDAVNRLGFDPNRIVNISAAADCKFRPLGLTSEAKASLCRRLGLSRPFIFYYSGADMRKNLRGAIAIFAALPEQVRQTHQLLLVSNFGPADYVSFKTYAESLNIEPQGLVMMRDIEDNDLVEALNSCQALLFPSLYEGFGLPVLEAMRCGAAVVAGQHSSIPEIVDRKDILFDVADVSSGAAVLNRVLSSAALRTELAEWGVARAASFNWRRSARLALDAFEDHFAARQRSTGVFALPCEFLDIDGARHDIGRILADASVSDSDVTGFAEDLVNSMPIYRGGVMRRLLIDVTDCARSGAWTGIQRVVRQLTRAFYEKGFDRSILPLAVRLEPEEIWSVPGFVAQTLGRTMHSESYPVEIQPGDDLFMLDSNWTDYPGYHPLFEREGVTAAAYSGASMI